MDDKQYLSHFGSITWNEQELHYSQAKIEIYWSLECPSGLPALHHWSQKYSGGINASYVKGMLNNPDIQPGAVVNRWIVGIKLFQFDLVHVPASTWAWMVYLVVPLLQMLQLRKMTQMIGLTEP